MPIKSIIEFNISENKFYIWKEHLIRNLFIYKTCDSLISMRVIRAHLIKESFWTQNKCNKNPCLIGV